MIKNKIIPTIFAIDNQTFEKKLELLNFAPEIHLDFMDGEFTQKSSIKISEMKNILKYSNTKFQIHLMAKEPIKYLKEICKLKIKQVLIHYEVFDTKENFIKTVDKFKKEKIQVFVVIKPSTAASELINVAEEVDGIMIMSVIPGAEGQKFIENTLKRIEFVRRNMENMIIQVDGGINDMNCRKLFSSGANVLCVGSYISSSTTPKDNFEKLKYFINN